MPDNVYYPDFDWDPYEERFMHRPLSDSETRHLFIKGCIGTSLLALPNAFKVAGILMAILNLIIVSVFCTYMLRVTIRTIILLCRIKRVGNMYYSEAMKFAFEVGPPCFKWFSHCIGVFTDLLCLIYQLCIMSSCLSYLATDVKRLYENFVPSDYPLHTFILLSSPYLLIIMCIKTLNVYAVFAFVGNVLTVVFFCFLVYYLADDLPNFTTVPVITDVPQNAMFFVPALYLFEAIPLILTVEHKMEEGLHFVEPRGIICQSYAILTIFYLVVGLMGYWRYEENIQLSLTGNFDLNNWVAKFTVGLFILIEVIGFGLNGLIAIHIMWVPWFEDYFYNKGEIRTGAMEYFLRIVLVAVSVTLAIYIPPDYPVMFLIGAICMSMLGVVFPALMEICALWPLQDYGNCYYICVRDAFLTILGITIVIGSIYQAVRLAF